MTEVKLTRLQARNLVNALQFTKRLSVPSRWRYATARNLDSLKSDYEATNEAYFEKAEDGTITGIPKSKEDFDRHLAEVITVNLYQTELPEIKDTQENITAEQRAMNEQLLVEWISPVIKET